MDTADLYDEEIKLIGRLSYELARKYGERWNEAKLESFKREAESKFFDLGFQVKVSTAEPLLGIGGPSIEIIDRIKPIEFDHEKKSWEIQKSRSLGGK